MRARPPDLAFWTGTRPRVVGVSPSTVPFLYSKCTAPARSLVSRYGRLNVLWPLRAHHSWTYPEGALSICHSQLVRRWVPRVGGLTPVGATVNSRGPRPRAAANECREYQVAACGSKLGTADRRRSLVSQLAYRLYRFTACIHNSLPDLPQTFAVPSVPCV